MFCIECGQQLPDNAHYCFKCGAKTINDTVSVKPTDQMKADMMLANIIEGLRQTKSREDYVTQKAEDFIAENTVMTFEDISADQMKTYVTQKASFIENAETKKETYCSRITPSVSQSNSKDNNELPIILRLIIEFVIFIVGGGVIAMFAGAIIDITLIAFRTSLRDLGIPHIIHIIIFGAVVGFGVIVFLKIKDPKMNLFD